MKLAFGPKRRRMAPRRVSPGQKTPATGILQSVLLTPSLTHLLIYIRAGTYPSPPHSVTMRLLLLCPLMCLILNATAWNFTWHDGATVTTQTGNGTIPCTRIYQTKGQPFEYYPNGDAMVLWLWGDTDCSGEAVGMAPTPTQGWR